MINELYCNPPRNRFLNSVIYREQNVSILITKCGAVRIIVTSVDDCSVSIFRHLKLELLTQLPAPNDEQMHL